MNFEEHAAKSVLATAAIAIPLGEVAANAQDAEAAARRIGACVGRFRERRCDVAQAGQG